MMQYGLPVLYALFVWWFSTGLILLLDGLPRRTYRWSMAGATGLLLAGFYGLWASSAVPTLMGAYAAFTCSLLVWGWHEIAFLMGVVTGPRRSPCPAGAGGWRRFVLATGTVLHHEIAIAATAALIAALTWDGPNQVGTWTFLVLWGMRLSAKLNVFLGVPHLPEEFLPEHLGYLKSYLAKKPMNLLFPVSITVGTVVLVMLVQAAEAPGAMAFEEIAFALLAALTALAILEHWFLVLPIPDAALWGWALRSRTAGPTVPPHLAPAGVPLSHRRRT